MRDYVTEMRNLIDQEATGQYVSAVIADQIVDKLFETDLDLLTGWLHAQAVTLVHQAINTRDRSRRTAARTAGPRSVFHEAAEAHEQGDSTELFGLLSTHYVVDAGQLRKPLAEMTAADLSYVSERYRDRASEAALEGAFFAALARKVGSGTVADHFTEDEIRSLRASIRS